MKHKFLLPPLLFFAVLDAAVHSDDATSKTFFSVEPQYTTCKPEHLTSYRKKMFAKKDGRRGCLEVVGFAGRTNSSADFARYFFPFWKTSLLIAEGPNPLATDGSGVFVGGSGAFKADSYDLLARSFDIETHAHNFKSNIFISPQQSYFGVALNYRQGFGSSEDSGYWLDITAPIIQVRNDINLNELIRDQGDPLNNKQQNMIDALNQCAWRYGKFSPTVLTKTGVADVEIRFGADVMRNPYYQYSSFVGIIVPTGNRPRAHYIFEPIVGRNHHWGLMWGSSWSFELSGSENYSIKSAIDLNSSYLFEANEVRSFDLVDKQWSRYIPVFTDATATTTSPGINTFTRCINVRPRATFQVNSALIFSYKAFEFEMGIYSFFRQGEEGKLTCAWQEDAAVAGVSAAVGSTQAQSMNLANMHIWDYKIISQDVDYGSLNTDIADNVSLYKTLDEEDLNIQSALHPSAIAAALYVAASYSWEAQGYPSFIGAGASYQLSADNIASQRWSIWCKIGLSI